MVGGFYAYDNRTEVKELGALCSGTTDDRGLLLCEATLDAAGQVELIAEAKDATGHPATAAATVWITKQGELWFSQDNDDRIDVLPEKKRYEPGETARLQVRMPFREATALVAVEREGVIATQVATLRGDDPTVELKVEPGWGPNVYVSVLALRGRIRETPWYSFFTWGWKEPLEWWRSFRGDGKDWVGPTAMVDLAKPAFKLGVAKLQVGLAAHELQVSVTADKPQYAVRQTAMAKIRVSQGGKPVAGAQVAFAAVDEGLLALRGNDSWNLLEAMIRERAWGVETSTAQSEIIGRRHYGRKAVAAGGGGGRGSARELFDTLLIWKANIVVDANGEATVAVPINDSLTSFRLVAVADAEVQKFGTGSTSIRVTQDLQVLAGLPPLVRDGDQFSAMLTLRNTTPREMKVRATLQGTANLPAAGGGTELARVTIALPPQDVVLAAGAAKEVVWPVSVPAEAISIAWEAAAEEGSAPRTGSRSRSSSPRRCRCGCCRRRWRSSRAATPCPSPRRPMRCSSRAARRRGAERAKVRGGLAVAVQPKLSGALPGMRRFFETYPFACLEQKTSQGGRPARTRSSGLASPTPCPPTSTATASPATSRRAPAMRRAAAIASPPTCSRRRTRPASSCPAPARDAMLGGLAAFVEGRIERKGWSPRPDLDVRKLAAIEALSRYGRAQAKTLGSIALTPNVWPTAAVIDWLNILKRVDGIPDRARRLEEASQILRGRLTYSGTTLKFSTEESDFWWWLMDSADANAARLILAVLDDPAWKDDLPKMVVGSLARQRRGAWLTTTANLWGSLALDKFAAKFESQKIAGATVAQIELPAPARRGIVGARRRLGSAAGGRSRDPALAAGSGHAHGRAAGQRQAVAHGAEPGGDSAEGAARRRLQHHAQRQRGRAEGQGALVARRHRPRAARDRRPGRHDLGRGQRPGAGRRDHPRLGPRAATRRWRRAPRSAPARPGRRSRSAASRPSAATTSTCRAASTSSSTACASTTRAGSRCRRRGSRRCTRRRASARRRTRASRSRREPVGVAPSPRAWLATATSLPSRASCRPSPR